MDATSTDTQTRAGKHRRRRGWGRRGATPDWAETATRRQVRVINEPDLALVPFADTATARQPWPLTVPLGPIDEPPADLLDRSNSLGQRRAERRRTLLEALDGVMLGDYDHDIARELIGEGDDQTVVTIASWLYRVRAAERELPDWGGDAA